MFIQQKGFFILTIVAVFSLAVTTVTARANPQFAEFPIAVGNDSTFAVAAAYDGTNYLVGIQGDILAYYNITAQLVSPTGSLVGSRISVGQTGGVPWLAFDGANYLMVWSDWANPPNLDIYGQFISTSGNLVGTSFPIAETAYPEEIFGGIAFGNSTYLVAWIRNDAIFGQRVDKSGNLVGGVIQISNNLARDEIAVAFDGINYLVVWVEKIDETDISVFGQLISEQGALVGTNFLIDGSSYPSDNPVAVCFDGSRYLVCFNDEMDTTSQYMDIFGRFVTTDGTVQERVAICEDTGGQIVPFIAHDGTNYLITWNDEINLDTVYCKGRFFNASGAPLDTVFTIFEPLEGRVPLGGVMGYDGSQYLVGANRVKIDTTGEFTDGDVYGTFIPSSTTGVEEKTDDRWEITGFRLQQNYPNPFNPTTTINYSVSKTSFVTIKVYNLAGKEVTTLLNEEKSPGKYRMEFSADNLPSGIYFYRMQSGSFTDTKKFILLR